MTDPILLPCSHIATAEECRRDPEYRSCSALANQPCVWARRWDGRAESGCHTERIEAAALTYEVGTPVTDEMFERAVEATADF